MTIKEVVEKHKDGNVPVNVVKSIQCFAVQIAVIKAENKVLRNILKENGISLSDTGEEFKKYISIELDKLLTDIEAK